MKPQKIEISYRTIIFTVLFLASLWLLWELRNLLMLFFVCFIFMEAINPAVNRLERLKIPRPLGIAFLYAIILSVVSFAIAGIIPALVEQTTGLLTTLPNTIADIKIFGASAADIYSQFKFLETLPDNLAKGAFSLFSNIISAFVVFVITFYMLLERNNFGKYSFGFFGEKGRIKTLEIINALENRLGNWVNAEIILMTAIGLLSYVGYVFLGLKYAVPLAILAGLLEVVPNIGPVISTALAALIGLTVSPLTALFAIIWGIVVQQVENNFLVPKVMKETIGINPLITILLLAVGAKLGGVIGAILAVPTYLTLESIYLVLSKKEQK